MVLVTLLVFVSKEFGRGILIVSVSLFRDVILEAKLNKPVGWTCNICSHSVPHLHVHKVIMQSGCDYLRGLFGSGMQER